ncbi:hypothetical protein RHGRI_018634 [Rhododendron griersonianum]|uniref:Uncharacterized protein n=1 Tax=Rhododendron griersonianum TaxID=479676 RepID=A0AAV6K246_9ERIC|nr:hypothetical protein RHGRI_018634 [Rhododendron griersonianum]
MAMDSSQQGVTAIPLWQDQPPSELPEDSTENLPESSPTRMEDDGREEDVKENEHLYKRKAELLVKPMKEAIVESEAAKGGTETVTVRCDGISSSDGQERNSSILFESAAFEKKRKKKKSKFSKLGPASLRDELLG